MLIRLKKVRFEVKDGYVRNADGKVCECTHVDCDVYFSHGGYNYFTYKREERGYYLSVQPVTVSENFVTVVAFTGFKKLLVPCGRQGRKLAAKAVAMFDDEVENVVMDAFINMHAEDMRKEVA